jgi:hypothetical protein
MDPRVPHCVDHRLVRRRQRLTRLRVRRQGLPGDFPVRYHRVRAPVRRSRVGDGSYAKAVRSFSRLDLIVLAMRAGARREQSRSTTMLIGTAQLAPPPVERNRGEPAANKSLSPDAYTAPSATDQEHSSW